MSTGNKHIRRQLRSRSIWPAILGVTTWLATLLILAPDSHGDNGLKDILEFRGYTRIGGVAEFSIYNKQTQQSAWVRVDQTVDGYRVEEFENDTNTLVIRYNGQIGTLSLQASQIARYIPPAPQSAPDSSPLTLPGTQSGQTASRGQVPQIPGAPSSVNPGQQSPTGTRTPDSRNQPQQLADTGGFRQGRVTPPASPGTPTPPGNGGGNGGNGDDNGGGNGGNGDDSDEWQSTGSPPPPPPTQPPTYSPED